MAAPSSLSVTWLGHSTFLLNLGGHAILTDPWIESNPVCPAPWKNGGWKRQLCGLELILVSHGNGDHCADALAVAKATGAVVVSIYEICVWLQAQGAPAVSGMNKGGTQDVGGVRVSQVHADHSSCEQGGQLVPLGEATGFVLRVGTGPGVYFAGDTAVFGDMALIREMHRPAVAFLPVGDHFTMGPAGAAKACALLGVKQVVPMHYGTFPLLAGTPAELRALVEPQGVVVSEFTPGQSRTLTL